MNLLNLLVLNLEAEHELAADHATAVVAIEGAQLFAGKAALREAREVAQFVERLRELGIPEAAVELEDARVQVEDGLLSRGSTARYSVAVRCDPLERLSVVLGAIAATKQAALEQLRWGYAGLAEAQRGWLEQLGREGMERARGMARALGVELRGVHRFVEAGAEPDAPHAPGESPTLRRRSGGTVTAADFGFSLGHRRKVKVGGTLELFIGPQSATVTSLKSV